MDKLYIISDTIEHGSYLANMKLGLSSGQFKIILSSDDVNYVPNGALYLHDDNHPTDSVLIDELLRTRCLNMINSTRLFDFIEGIYNHVQYVNNIYSFMLNESSTAQGRSKLKQLLIGMGLSQSNGFEYEISRTREGAFGIIPQSDLARLVVTLYASWYKNVLLPQTQLKGATTIYPV